MMSLKERATVIQILPITDLRKNAMNSLEAVKENPIVITRRGRPCAVLVDYKEYRQLIERLERLQMEASQKEEVECKQN